VVQGCTVYGAKNARWPEPLRGEGESQGRGEQNPAGAGF
jgi:hypothetical protein